MSRQKLELEVQISFIKKTFSESISQKLNLISVSSPIAIIEGKGINDDLNGTERPVRFPIKSLNDQEAVVVHSLAKWKRIKLQEYELEEQEGILTDMQALRPDEDYSPIHSIFVDQWDWEIRIGDEDRTIEYLKKKVNEIYQSIVATQNAFIRNYAQNTSRLPETIHFIHSQELLDLYPTLTPKQREDAIAKKYGAVFIIGIGSLLTNKEKHDGRSADYDDWSTTTPIGKGLNGDILVWNSVLEHSFELSSMGIRVNKESLLFQLEQRNELHKKDLTYHQMVLNDQIPLSIGGGIGQSRLCMFLLGKKHIGEVQVGIWNENTKENLKQLNIHLL